MAVDSDVVALLLGAGGATAIGAAVRGYLAIRDSAEVREGKAVRNLERWIAEADGRALRCQQELDTERTRVRVLVRRVGTLEHLLISHGIPVPEDTEG
jgi:hypothetical protein